VVTSANARPFANVEADASAAPHRAGDRSAAADGDGGQLGDSARRREGVPGNAHEGAAPDLPTAALESASRSPQRLGQPAPETVARTVDVSRARVAHTAPSPHDGRVGVFSEETLGGGLLLLAAVSPDAARIAASAIAANERRWTGDARSAAEGENDRFRAELRADIAEQDALWAAYPKEMRELEAAEHAFEDALRWSDGERRRANRRLEWAQARLEKAKERRR
jgi:hypothetical protein